MYPTPRSRYQLSRYRTLHRQWRGPSNRGQFHLIIGSDATHRRQRRQVSEEQHTAKVTPAKLDKSAKSCMILERHSVSAHPKKGAHGGQSSVIIAYGYAKGEVQEDLLDDAHASNVSLSLFPSHVVGLCEKYTSSHPTTSRETRWERFRFTSIPSIPLISYSILVLYIQLAFPHTSRKMQGRLPQMVRFLLLRDAAS